jgi:hypothetical protein
MVEMVISNVPVTYPLELPLEVNVAFWVVEELKQGGKLPMLKMLKRVMFTPDPLACARLAVIPRTGVSLLSWPR